MPNGIRVYFTIMNNLIPCRSSEQEILSCFFDGEIMDKRTFLKTSAAMGLGAMAGSSLLANSFMPADVLNDKGEYTLPPLPYAYDALEPHIDQQTMKLHHDIHHKSYVDGLNKAIKMIGEATEKNDFALIKHWEREMAFHGSGHFLHTLFWQVMGPSQGKMTKALETQIGKDFGSADKFKTYFKAAAGSVEGSGWAILAWEPAGRKLVIMQAEKHQNQTAWGVIPILPLDVWEHAYYLKYQNKRADYAEAFMKVINWNAVSENFDRVIK